MENHIKMSRWLVYSLITVFLISCGSPVNSNTFPEEDRGSNNSFSEEDRGGEDPSIPIEEPESAAPMGGGNQPASIRIRKETAPAGILEQISWGGQGGAEGLGREQNCGSCEAGIKNGLISFRDFEPWQELEALIYQGGKTNECNFDAADYVTTLYVQMDENGNFSSDLSGFTNNLTVVLVNNAGTGETLWQNYLEPYGQIDCSEGNTDSCPGAPPQRLEVDEMAYVCTARDSVKLREGPGKNFSIIKSLVPGAEVEITGGPVCANNWSWWEVRTESGYTGWMSEGGDQTDPYFLCPKP